MTGLGRRATFLSMSGEKGRRRRVLTVDIGTSSLKGGILDEEGLLRQWGKVGFGLPVEGGYSSWSAERWLGAFAELVASFAAAENETPDIDAVVISGNGPSLVPVDRTGKPAAEALLWLDRRERRREGTVSFFLPKAAWLAEERPEVYEKTARFLGCPEFLSFRLCGTAAAFTPSDEFTPYIWSPEEIGQYRLDVERFPPPVYTGRLLGEVSAAAAERFGLKEGLAVIAGGADFLMALLGTGTVRPGRTCDRTGTSEGINCCSSRFISHPRIRSLPHALEGYYNAAGILSSTGMIFEWFRRLTGQEGRDYDEMLKEVDRVRRRPGLPLFFPSLHHGAVWEFAGGAFTRLEAEHGPAEMGRAVVNSIGFGIRDLVETLEKEGCAIDSLRVSGGQGRNTVWNQMKADMTGKPIEIPRIIDAELTGGAVAAFSFLDGESLFDTAERMVRIEKSYEADPQRAGVYREEYEEYQRACERMLPALAGPK